LDIQRSLPLYLDGELGPERIEQVERHLMDCAWCRGRLAQLRDGQKFAKRMPLPVLDRDPWEQVEKSIDEEPQPATLPRTRRHDEWRHTITRPGPLIALTGLAFLLVLLVAVSTSRPDPSELRPDPHLNRDGFQNVAIADIGANTRPHVVTEGYVSEVRLDKDGDLTFRLVENLAEAEPFIVCEIIPSLRLEPPMIGSRVRVYGVSRFDNQPGREWHEVHPVLGIEAVQ
jgi:hypothetical protein